MTDKPDEIDEIKNILFDLHDLLDSYSDLEYRANYMQELLPRLKQAILALKSKWEAEAYKKGYIDGGINQLTNGDK